MTIATRCLRKSLHSAVRLLPCRALLPLLLATTVSAAPPAVRNSTTATEAPAIALDAVNGLTFGGNTRTHGLTNRPRLLVDYTHGGCLAIGARGSRNVTIRDLEIDALRLPFTVGLIHAVTDETIVFAPEVLLSDRTGVYAWDSAKYPWLEVSGASARIPSTTDVPGALGRATRELPSAGIESTYTSSVNAAGLVTLVFSAPDQRRRKLQPGERLFIKHFDNLQSWGVYGFGVEDMTLDSVSLFSTSGMGFRCDFCNGTYNLLKSDISIKPGSRRPMSITADAVHFMHTSGKVVVADSSFGGQGDDGFNLHGNFIVLGRRINATTSEYVDETGPGWITATPTFIVGDTVEFYSRKTLAPLGRGLVAEATGKVVRFEAPIPEGVLLWDMFVSLDRIASLHVTRCTFANSNARGVLVSGVDAIIEDNVFANLTGPGLLVFEGGCGAGAGDYTEGPLTRDVIVRRNIFDSTGSVDHRNTYSDQQAPYVDDVNNVAALQIGGCRPRGECGLSGGVPYPGAAAIANLFQPAEASTLRVVPFVLPPPEAGGISEVTHLLYHSSSNRPLKELAMALYASTYEKDGKILTCDHPTSRLASTSPSTTWEPYQNGWWRAALSPPLKLRNGTFFVAHWYGQGQPWKASAGPGEYRSWHLPSAAPSSVMRINLADNWANWTTVATSAVPIAVMWTAEGGWCDTGGTLPPPLVKHFGDKGAGRITESGELVHRTFLRNFTVAHNRFSAPVIDPKTGKPWSSGFMHIGGVDGLRVINNTLARRVPRPNDGMVDVTLYSNTAAEYAGNTCSYDVTGRVPCIVAHQTSQGKPADNSTEIE